MHSRSKSGISIGPIVVGVIALVIVAVVAILLINQAIPILQVSGVSLSPTEININSSANLQFTIKNNDASNPHDVKVLFNVTSVTFYMNNVSLSKDNSGMQYYNIQLQSSQQSTYVFGVTGKLTGGASTSTYLIRLDFYNENLTKFDSETQNLKVDSS